MPFLSVQRVWVERMRAIIIVSLALVVSVTLCMVFLALFAGIGGSTAVLATVGLGLFMVAALFAAISALGPKFRPTPLLTPTMAGTLSAAALTMVIIAAGNPQPLNGQRVAHRQSPPPVATAPAPVEPSVATMAPVVPMVQEPQVPPVRMAAPISPPEAPVEAPQPVESVLFAPEADVAPTVAAEPPDVAVAEAASEVALAPASPPAPVPIPLPPIPPRFPAPSDTLVFSEEPFDPSSASTLANTPVTPSPPLPRSRPCGEDGPPCP